MARITTEQMARITNPRQRSRHLHLQLGEAKSAPAEQSIFICELGEAKSAPAEQGNLINHGAKANRKWREPESFWLRQ